MRGHRAILLACACQTDALQQDQHKISALSIKQLSFIIGGNMSSSMPTYLAT